MTKTCGTCTAWGAKDGTIEKAPCVRLSERAESLDMPSIRQPVSWNGKPGRTLTNVLFETPRSFGCNLHQGIGDDPDLI